MAFGDPTVIESGVPGSEPEQGAKPDPVATTPAPPAAYLAEHAAVRKQGYGVSTTELASFVEVFADYAKSRVEGTGHAEYESAGTQKFESMSFDTLVYELVDELADAQNYITMLSAKALSLLGAMGNE